MPSSLGCSFGASSWLPRLYSIGPEQSWAREERQVPITKFVVMCCVIVRGTIMTRLGFDLVTSSRCSSCFRLPYGLTNQTAIGRYLPSPKFAQPIRLVRITRPIRLGRIDRPTRSVDTSDRCTSCFRPLKLVPWCQVIGHLACRKERTAVALTEGGKPFG